MSAHELAQADAPQPLDVYTCPLEGFRVVEASAGTGKTWNICGLVLRLLLERAIELRRILVVTFTNAATAELRERIRQRLLEAAAVLGGGPAGSDPLVPRLVQALRERGLDDATLRTRVEAALAGFDEAAILTIHGFCQRALTDLPFAAQQPYTSELVQDDSELVAQVARDFWRREVAAGADPALCAALELRRDTPETFARQLERRLRKPTARLLWPAGLDEAPGPDLAAVQNAHDAARALWQAGSQEIVDCVNAALPDLKANVYKPASLASAAEQWHCLLADADALGTLSIDEKDARRLTRKRLEDGTKKSRTPPRHPFFDAAQDLLDARDAAKSALAAARLRLLRRLLTEGPLELREHKQRHRLRAFDDLLSELHERLCGGAATELAAALRGRFEAALIDESQDTDPLQFAIFRALYGEGAHALFLVGDPKQAIYSFRNADLHTYLRARAQAQAEYTLTANQRSVPALLDALNGLFGANPRAFVLPGLAYRAVSAGDKPRASFVDRGGPEAALRVWQLPRAEGGAWPAKAEAQALAARACAAEVARLLAAAQRGDALLDGRALRAGEIALLVRTHAEGRLVRDALAALGVGSVELAPTSVFASDDAEELERLLAAVLEPGRERRLRAALATQAMGHDAAALDALAGDEAALAGWMQRFAAWRELWQQRGIGVMLRRWLDDEGVAKQLLARADGERRLTNLLHLAELLHAAAAAHPGPDALLRWLQTQRAELQADEALQLRLESDRNLVQVVTVHRSKGLEYPVVLCPFLWSGALDAGGPRIDGEEYHDDDGMLVIDFRKDVDAAYDEKAIAQRRRLEQAAERVRLLYVALTRASHRCVVVAGASHPGRGTRAGDGPSNLLNWLAAGSAVAPGTWLGSKPTAEAIEVAWAGLAARCAPHIELAALPTAPPQHLANTATRPETIEALAPPRHIAPPWRIGSYSSLVHGATHEAAAADHDLLTAESLADTVPEREAAAVASAATPPEPDDVLHFARGAAAGECIHAVLEQVDFTESGGWPAAVEAALRRHGAALGPGTLARTGGDPTLDARRLLRMLDDLTATPLPVGTPRPLRLAEVPRARRIVELGFHMPVAGLDARALNAALREVGYAMPRLGFAALEGYVEGYIDLVVEHDGRWFVIDWKSNHLGDRPEHYAGAALEAAMTEHGYHLQHLLYSVALERLLRRRLRDFEPQRHFGGVLYLFVRGLRPHWRAGDGRPCGLYFHRPSPQTLARVGTLLDGVARAPGGAVGAQA